jgi:hypothetical protein
MKAGSMGSFLSCGGLFSVQNPRACEQLVPWQTDAMRFVSRLFVAIRASWVEFPVL